MDLMTTSGLEQTILDRIINLLENTNDWSYEHIITRTYCYKKSNISIKYYYKSNKIYFFVMFENDITRINITEYKKQFEQILNKLKIIEEK